MYLEKERGVCGIRVGNHIGGVGGGGYVQCMSKHVKGVKSRNNFRLLRHTWHWMVWLERSKSQLSKTFFGLKIH